ncbi:MAG: choice-of-anchor D domain-containing protein [Deltaproteobacteria bacterium]|nr:choice-of-anchor D domain-containing protein [Deltaproteobacteria bacterium]
MIHIPRQLAFAAFALLAAVSGCDCSRGRGVTRSNGQLGVLWKNTDDVEVISRDATYDFGKAAVGDRIPKLLIVRNLAAGPLTLVSLELADGDKVKVGDAAVEGAAFEVAFAETTLQGGEEKTFQMFYSPPPASDATQLKQAHLSKLLLTTANAPEGEATADITLKGEAEQGGCALPPELDFGKVTVGDTFPAIIALTNTTSLEVVATAGSPEGTNGDQNAFGFADGSPRGNFPLTGNTSAAVTYTFSPTEVRTYTATVTLRAGPSCPPGTVTLKGEGVTADVLTWTPSSLDFGYVSPGTEAPRKVTFTNIATAPIVLTQVIPSLPNDYYTQTEPGQAPQTFTVPGGGVPVDMTVICKPSELGAKDGTLTFKTGLKKTPAGTIQLKCFGGGPDIKVVPSPALAFGKVAFTAGASVGRRITVSNVGTRVPNATTTDANLKLGTVAADGTPGQAPLLALQPANGSTSQSEFSVLPGAYDPAKGIEAVVGRNSLDLQVTLTPASVGFKEADLFIFSNDPDEPETVIRISADVQALQPCTYTVSPAALNFGLVTPPGYKELPFTIKNTGPSGGPACEISGVDVAMGSDPAYSITGGAIASKTLNPGETLQVVVKSNPQVSPPNGATITLSGTVAFNINGTPAQGAVNLTTSVGPSCLTVAPDVLDFGTVKTGCASSPRTFTAYNTCPTPISLSGSSLAVGAPEFALVTAPPNTTLQPGSAGVTFQAKYMPQDIGPDQGAISLNVNQGGNSVVYLVTLSGTGDASGLQTDTFVQDLKPKADILLVIDDSGSMQDKQNELSQNFGAFFQYANAAGVDYQLGVTTTDVDPQTCFFGQCTGPGPMGKLIGDASNPKILTSTTPNVGGLYAQKVKVGTNGSGEEKGLAAAELALTPPLITSDNAGFVRQDANLAVVVVTDAVDQSPKATSYYLNRLLNVKGFNKANMFTFSVIGPFQSSAPSSCSYDGSSPDTRYAYLATQTSGVKAEICNSNWNTTLQNLGKTAFGYRSSFYMNGTPDPSRTATIKVTLDGVDIPAGAGAWAYDSTANAVVFNTSNPPTPGQTLTVTYFTACFPPTP